MEKWVKELLAEVDSSTKFIEPENEVKKGETIVGVANQWSKKLFTLWKKTTLELLGFKDKIKQVKEGSSEYNELIAKLYQLASKIELLEDMLGYSINCQFSLWDKRCVGIRKGFRVVWYEEEDTHKAEKIKCNIIINMSPGDAGDAIGRIVKEALEEVLEDMLNKQS